MTSAGRDVRRAGRAASTQHDGCGFRGCTGRSRGHDSPGSARSAARSPGPVPTAAAAAPTRRAHGWDVDGVHQPIPVRRPPTQVPALFPGLGSHRRQHPVPRPQGLGLRLRTERHDQCLRHRILPLPPATGHRPRASTSARRSARTVPSPMRTRRRRTPARTRGPPRRRTVAPATPARSATQQPEGGRTTGPAANSPRRRTRPSPPPRARGGSDRDRRHKQQVTPRSGGWTG